jgi:hypothetical protein
MHHDPLLRSARKSFASVGHVWVVLALWVPLPFGTGRGFALPVWLMTGIAASRSGAPGQERRRLRRERGHR